MLALFSSGRVMTALALFALLPAAAADRAAAGALLPGAAEKVAQLRQALECDKRSTAAVTSFDTYGVRPGSVCGVDDAVLGAVVLAEDSATPLFNRTRKTLAEELLEALARSASKGKPERATVTIQLPSMPDGDWMRLDMVLTRVLPAPTPLGFLVEVTTKFCAVDKSNDLQATSSLGAALRQKYGEPSKQLYRDDVIKEAQAASAETERKLRAQAAGADQARARETQRLVEMNRQRTEIRLTGLREWPADTLLRVHWAPTDGTQLIAVRGAETECVPRRPEPAR